MNFNAKRYNMMGYYTDLEHYFNESALHGLHRLLNKNIGIWNRRLWTFLFISMFLLFGYYEYNLCHEIFIERPTVTHQYYTRQSRIKFPIVLLCDNNLSKYRLDKLMEISGNTTGTSNVF